MRRVHLVSSAPLLLMILLCPMFGSCGDDGGTAANGNGNGGTNSGIYITASNVEVLAEHVVSAMSIFPRLSQALIAMIQKAENLDPAAFPAPTGLIDLGDLGFCPTGESSLSWNDADEDSTLSTGDTLILSLIDCDSGVDGTITLFLMEVGYALTTAEIQLDLHIEDVVDEVLETEVMTGRFRAEVNRIPGPPEGAIFRYLVADQTDGSSLIRIERNGETAEEIGCFNLYYTFNLETGGFTLSEPAAVFRIPEYGVLSMISWGLPALVFPDGEHPESGEAGFFAYSSATPCAGLEIGGSGVDSNNSTFTLTATGGGGITLAGESDDGASFSVQKNWNEID